MSAGNDNAENPMARPPLGLPVGSVRALVTILILAVVVVETMRNHELPALLNVTVLIAVAHYFNSRRYVRVSAETIERLERDGQIPAEKHPLYLPRYMMRVLILAAFGGVGYYMYTVHGVRTVSDVPEIMIAGASYLLGATTRVLFSRDSKPGQAPRRIRLWNDLNAMVVILIVVGISLVYFLNESEALPKDVRNYILAIVLYYFGSR